jgi:hypothetical protein
MSKSHFLGYHRDHTLTALGVFPTGPITLSSTLTPSLLINSTPHPGFGGEAHRGSSSEEDEDDRQRRKGNAKAGSGGLRRGKTGIRNGFAGGGGDYDE